MTHTTDGCRTRICIITCPDTRSANLHQRCGCVSRLRSDRPGGAAGMTMSVLGNHSIANARPRAGRGPPLPIQTGKMKQSLPDQSVKTLPKPQPAGPASGWFSYLDRGSLQTMLLAAIAGIMVLGFLDDASLIIVPTVLAVLCAIALAPLVRKLQRYRLPASFAAAVIVAGLLGGAGTTVYMLVPSAEAWNERAPQILREVERRARQITSGLSGLTRDAPAADATLATPAAPADPDAATAEETDDTVGRLMEGGQRLMADWAIGAPGLVAATVYWAVLTFFLLRDKVMLGRWLMSLVVGASARRAIGRAMRDVRTDVAQYLLAITAINFALGVCTAVAFQLLGVANAPLWGVAAALLNFMPFIGAAVMALLTLGLGMISFGDPLVAYAPFFVMVALNTIEGQIITPMVVGARIRLPAIAVFAAIAFGAWLWGASGALVATPSLIVVVAFVRRLNAATGRPLSLVRKRSW